MSNDGQNFSILKDVISLLIKAVIRQWPVAGSLTSYGALIKVIDKADLHWWEVSPCILIVGGSGLYANRLRRMPWLEVQV